MMMTMPWDFYVTYGAFFTRHAWLASASARGLLVEVGAGVVGGDWISAGWGSTTMRWLLLRSRAASFT